MSTRRNKHARPVPPFYQGRDVFVLGGGRSVREEHRAALRGRAVIAVNSSYTGVPGNTPVVFHDRRWLGWHAEQMRRWGGPIFTSSPNVQPSFMGRVHFLNKIRPEENGGEFMTDRPDSVAARDSGGIGVNLAFHAGARRIVLLGFDMGFETEGEAHWYPEHPIPARLGNYVNRFLPQYPLIARWLRARGVPLLTITETAIPAEHVPRTTFEKLDAACLAPTA